MTSTNFGPHVVQSILLDPKFPLDEGKLRQMNRVCVGNSAIAMEVMVFPCEGKQLRPLVIIGSTDYRMPPSLGFCQKMRNQGLQVIYVRRPGFGDTPPLPKVLLTKVNVLNGSAVVTEAAMIHKLLKQMEIRDFVLLGMGSANPLCYRLAMMNADISLSIFSNCVFNQDILNVFQPNWLQHMLRQALKTKSGLRVAELGLKLQLRRNPIAYLKQFLRKSQGDLDYLAQNEGDFLASSAIQAKSDSETFFYDISMSLLPDRFLKDHLFELTNAVALTGEETTDHWKLGMESECKRLGLDVVYAPSGDVFVPYMSPDTLLDVIRSRL